MTPSWLGLQFTLLSLTFFFDSGPTVLLWLLMSVGCTVLLSSLCLTVTTIGLWRSSPNDSLRDYRMTRRAFGVSSSLFVANMCVKQNAIDYASQYFLATMAVDLSFYVDYCLCVADSVENAIDRFSSFTILTRVTAWILRFIHNCCVPNEQNVSPTLTVQELIAAEHYWVRFSQANHFVDDITALRIVSLQSSDIITPLSGFQKCSMCW